MEIKIQDVKNLKYHVTGSVVMDVLFEHIGDYVPFHATKDDPIEHGKQLFEDAIAGKYGSIADADVTETQHTIRMNRIKTQSEISSMEGELSILRDAVDLNIATAEETIRYNKLRERRVELSRLIK